MNDQPRTKLTKDVILRDYDEASFGSSLGVMPVAVYGFLLLLLIPPTSAVFTFLIILGVFTIIMYNVVKVNKTYPDKMQKGEYSITEETITRKAKKSDSDGDYYYIYFGTLEISVNLSLSRPYRPSYAETQIGDRYYLVKTPNKEVVLAYSKKQWYINDETEEDLMQEAAEKKPLICRVMECEPSPKLTYRRKHDSEESRSYARKILNKPGWERDFLEELAAKHFYGDIMLALEYIVRYCPALLWNEVEEELSDSQQELVPFVIAHVKAEEKDKKCKEKYAE